MDLYLLNLFNQTLAHPWLDPFMVGLTTIGLAIIPVIAALFAARGDRRMAGTIIVALAASAAITILFYALGMRPRPHLDHEVRHILPPPLLPAFPSGHAALAFATSVLLALRLRRWQWTFALLGGAAAISFSRVYLGHHYPSDLLAGALLGSAIGAASYGLAYCGGPPLDRLRWLLWPQIALALVVTEMAYLDLLPWHLLAWPNADKVLHFTLFGLVAFWLNLWMRGRMVHVRLRGRWLALMPFAVLLPLLFALSEEFLQAFSPLRTASIADLGADLAGLFCFWGLSTLLIRTVSRSGGLAAEKSP